MKDKVYAVYGVAPEKIQRLYPANYDKHVGQVSHQTAAYFFQYEYDRIDTLFYVYEFRDWQTPGMLSSYPSWVHDFSAKEVPNIHLRRVGLSRHRISQPSVSRESLLVKGPDWPENWW